MRELVLIAALGLGLAGCAPVEAGYASYDALARARQACVQQGEDLQLREAGDPERLADYGCVGK